MYTAADGLVHDRVLRIVRDSRGFLWFCTAGGLSRFDGQRFVSYSAADGLPIQTVTNLLENSDGSYWITTNGAGIVRYDPSAYGATPPAIGEARSRFATFSVAASPAANRVNTIHRDRERRLWIGTDSGLFLVENETARPEFRRITLNIPSYSDHHVHVWSFAEDSGGNLWIGTSAGLVHRVRDGRTFHHRIQPARGSDHVWSLMVDPEQQLWIGHDTGVSIVVLANAKGVADAGRSVASVRVAGARVLALLRSSDGHVWGAGDSHLYEFAGGRVKVHGVAQGLDPVSFQALEEDAHGNIWAGTHVGGAARIARDGLMTFTRADGLDHEVVGTLFETKSGQLCAVTRGSRVNVFDGQRFRAIVPKPRRVDDIRGNSYYAAALLDHAGEWWVPLGATLYRFPPVEDPSSLAVIHPTAVYTLNGDPAAGGIWRLFEDSRGDVWIARRVAVSYVVSRLDRATGALHHYSNRDGLPLSTVTAIAEDREGTIWIGFWDAPLARYRHGRFQVFPATQAMLSNAGGVSALYIDAANRVWCGTNQGLIRIDDSGAESPRITLYSTEHGLAESVINTIVGDQSGRLYVGTRRGVDRLDPISGRIRHFTTADGLAALETRVAYRDRQGALWFGTGRGLSRLLPVSDPQQIAPTIFLQSVRIDGVRQPVPDSGISSVGPLRAPSPRSRIEIDYFALSFQPGEPFKYQYKLEGVDSWSPATDERSVAYPRLAHGTYRFLVRAILSDGSTSAAPASLAFTIPPPLWARWWFLAAVASMLMLAAHTAHRYRVARLLEIERIRTRLAMDLHDDIGSTLSQVAVLSEVARRRVEGDDRSTELLERIAEISRQLVDAMSDVVWAINPERDSLRDLQQRMRRFATESLDAQNIRLRFEGPGEDVAVRLDANVRREVFLIFKEGINNVLRYAKCTRTDVGLQLHGSSLVLTIEDDGIGVDSTLRGDGLGLRSMRERAQRLQAELQLDSAPGRGTALRLVVPVGRHASLV